MILEAGKFKIGQLHLAASDEGLMLLQLHVESRKANVYVKKRQYGKGRLTL
jgi:hypothetical protein